ncbi:MAG: NUDIX domain-containing protein [Anaerolineae bacterium]|nr:NUDIX domain-containing protein [Anaerolineae bacterium]
MTRQLGVLVYALRGDEVLLMRRRQEPNLGLWIAPGGKVELDEAPHETARREMLEETGLVVDHLEWKGFCTEVSPLPDWQWMLFIYITRDFTGTLKPNHREGDLAWVSRSTYYHHLPIPQADAVFAPRVLEDDGMFIAKFAYDQDLILSSWTDYDGL